MNAKLVKSFKGFDKELKCRGFQYSIGETATHNGPVKLCEGGLHACEDPRDVFSYHVPAGARFCEVEQSGTVDRGDDKTASSELKVVAEIGLAGLIKARIDYTLAGIKTKKGKTNTGDCGAASNTGGYSAASNTGDYGAASNTGVRGAASNTGDYGAASNTGDCGAASNTGGYSAAFTNGWRSSAETDGIKSVAVAVGYTNKAKATKGNWLVLAFRDDNQNIKHIKAAQAGVTKGVKPDTWYELTARGTFKKVA